MGGVGSGRYRWDRRAVTVEECWALAVRTVEGAPVFELRAPDRSVDAVEVACPDGVELTTVRPHFGGLRWLFRCPAIVDGEPCNRRVGWLYAMDLESGVFACRRCHGLTYRSCQQSHRWAGLARQLTQSIRAQQPTSQKVGFLFVEIFASTLNSMLIAP
jgi:hypothetical protein